MKQFLKSFITSLMIGIPLTAILIVVLFLHQNTVEHPEVPDSIGSVTEADGNFPDPVLKTESDSSAPDLFTENSDPTEEIPETQSAPVTFAFAGDVYFSDLVMENYDRTGIRALTDQEMLEQMQSADCFILNNEFAFSNRGEAMEDKEYTLRCDPEYVSILQDLGTDIVSIANNHVLDFGRTAFLDTLDTLENAQITAIGGGHNLTEASAPAVVTIHGQTFAIFAATRVSPSYDWYAGKDRSGIMQTYDAEPLNRAITEAEALYDHTIVFVHWGIERNETPEEYQRRLAKGYIDAGADLVIGCHPHVLQGFEFYNGVPIVYSLGNYLFGNRTGETLLLNAIFDDNGSLSIQLIPCQRMNGVLTKISEPKELFDHLTNISFGASISSEGLLMHN